MLKILEGWYDNVKDLILVIEEKALSNLSVTFVFGGCKDAPKVLFEVHDQMGGLVCLCYISQSVIELWWL